jgi:asparagine synthetase B (glutamine-hydrolysing)
MALTPLEIACGIPLPAPQRPPRLPRPGAGTTPRTAFERAILTGLRRGPCLVSFSGGRDSSAVLAVATAVARREGLAAPIPVTHRFAAAARTDESLWQEQVIAHLGLDDWVILEADRDLDCIGPVATETMRRHGLLWPCNAYFHVPILAHGAGGSLLTGIGGDEAFSASTWARQLAILRGRVRPQPRDVLRVGFALAPAAVKARLIQRRLPELCPWLQPQAQREVAAAVAAEAAREPLRWRSRYRHLLGAPAMNAGLATLAALGADDDVETIHPFCDGEFLAALAALPAARRHGSRSQAMAALVGDLLPDTLISRSTKAEFGGALWSGGSLEFARAWSGEGVDREIVDVDRLAAEWQQPEPDTHTVTLLQSLWMSQSRADARPTPAATPSGVGG